MSVINTNINSLNAQRNLSASQSSLATSMQRLSSGMRINSAKDDAAGLSIATKMDSQIRGMSQAVRNANDGISLAQTADAGLSTATDALQRMRELAVQAANGTNTTTDSKALDTEYQALGAEVVRISVDTKFNGSSILNSTSTATTIQVGANGGQTISIPKVDLETVAKTLSAGTTASTTTSLTGSSVAAGLTAANAALTKLDAALTSVNGLRADLGAVQNRMGYAVSNLQSGVENQSAAKSRIMDTDFAAETANLSRSQVLQQAGTAMVAQANQLPQGVLALLR